METHELPADIHARLAALEQHNAQLRADQQQLETTLAQLTLVWEAVPYILVITSVADGIVSNVNPVGERMMQRPRAAWINRSIDEVFASESASVIRANQRRCLAEGQSFDVEEHLILDGHEIWMNTIYTPLRTPHGDITAILITTFDITARKQREREQLRQHAERLAQQSATLVELSTPLLTIGPGVVLMPLIGIIDAPRAEQLIDTLLHGIAATQARYAILDVTAVPLVDTQVASTLIRAAHAAQLLGTQSILTGIRPEVAQTLISLGVDLQHMHTQADLQHGIAFALRQVRGV